MGVFATHIPTSLYGAQLPKVLKCLNEMISDEEAFNEENVIATESALGALGKVIYFQKDNNMVNDAMVNEFLKKLPLTHEEEEACKSHQLLLEQTQAKNANLLNANTQAELMNAIIRIS